MNCTPPHHPHKRNTMSHHRSLTSIDYDPDEVLKKHFADVSIENTVPPIPYSADVKYEPSESTHHGEEGLKHKKITIVGCGQVGMAIAYAILNQEICGSLSLIDINEDKLDGEAKDLRQGSAFHQRMRIQASSDYSVSEGSHLVIVTAGVAQKVGESRLSLVERNVKIMGFIIPKVLEYSPNAPICIVSNPCDIMTAVAAKIAGPTVPPGQIFGSGTCLDSSRLRSLIGMALNVDTRSVHGYIIGEHGDSSIPVWSGVRAGGIPLLKPGEIPSEAHAEMHKEVVQSAMDVITKKGYTNWAVGLTAAYIAKNVLSDTHSIMPASTCVRGLYGIENDVFLSLPCVIGGRGVRRVLCPPLSETEKEGFQNSAKQIWDVQKGVWDTI